ncbi:hypothetical protein O3P69_000463 [Scylla paramamosain]|uniref:Uncharacterized protein n=1 Tax=Scylla paramamosain TaxID=85552 RepID=A0AAW0UV13_SCYPA
MSALWPRGEVSCSDHVSSEANISQPRSTGDYEPSVGGDTFPGRASRSTVIKRSSMQSPRPKANPRTPRVDNAACAQLVTSGSDRHASAHGATGVAGQQAAGGPDCSRARCDLGEVYSAG